VRVRLGLTGSTTAADCQLFLWQAERMTRRHSRDDPREDVGVRARVGVGVGPVAFQFYHLRSRRHVFTDRVSNREGKAIGNVRPCLFPLIFELTDLGTCEFLFCVWITILVRLGLRIKVVSQGQGLGLMRRLGLGLSGD